MKEDGSHSFSSVEHCLPCSFYFHRPKDRLRWFLIKRIMYALLYRAIEAEREWIQSENVDRCRRYFQIPSYNKVRNTKNMQRLAIHERVSKHHSWEIIIVRRRDHYLRIMGETVSLALEGSLKTRAWKKGQRLKMFWTIYQLFYEG